MNHNAEEVSNFLSSNSLPLFFRSLALQLESADVSTEQLLRASELFVYYTVQCNLDNLTTDEREAVDGLKMFTMGYYVYLSLKVTTQNQDEPVP
jgi:hypothetical protein